MRSKTVTLAMLKKAAPGGWTVYENRTTWQPLLDWLVFARRPGWSSFVEVTNPDRQTARRAALAALKELSHG